MFNLFQELIYLLHFFSVGLEFRVHWTYSGLMGEMTIRFHQDRAMTLKMFQFPCALILMLIVTVIELIEPISSAYPATQGYNEVLA